MVIAGRLKIPYNDLFYYSFDDLSAMAEGHEIDQRDAWERERWLASTLLSPHMKKGKTLKPKDLIVFPWERDERPTAKKLLTPERIEKANKLREILKKMDNGKVRS